MKNIEEALNLKTIEEIEEEIQSRKKVLLEMVGRVYPTVICDEIYKLRIKLDKLKNDKNK